MDIKIDELLDKVSGHVQKLASTETILGDEFTIGEYSCRPVIKVGTGFSSGAADGTDPKGKNKGHGGGAAAGIGVTPVGFLVARGEEISFVPSDKRSVLAAILDKVPDLVEKVTEMKNKEEKEEKKEAKKEDKK